jgi:dihydroflavonol-4-reductase
MILVTGATGLVGSHLLWQLLQQEKRVVALMRSTSSLQAVRAVFASYSATPDVFLSRVDWRVAAITDRKAMEMAMEGITVVFHCAAVVSLGGSSGAISDVNVTGTSSLVELCLQKKIHRFYFVSSIAACGNYADGRPVDENAPWTGLEHKSLYAQSKYLAEQEVWKAIDKGLHAAIVNPGVILGFSGVNSGSSMLFHRVKKGLPFYIDGGSGYVGVKDVVKALMLVYSQDLCGERFILVAENFSNHEILAAIAHGFRKQAPRIKIGNSLLVAAGHLMALAGKIFHFDPPLNATSARTSAHRTYYSSEAVKNRLHMEFTPVKAVVEEVCEAMLKTTNSKL